MNMDMEKHSDYIVKRAAELFAQRHGATSSQRNAREAWLGQDRRHAQAYDELQRMWDRMGELGSDPQLMALKSAALAEPRRRRWFPSRPLLAAAAAVSIMVGMAYFTVLLEQPQEVAHYATEVGERRTEIMPDGTEVVLNTGSAITIRYSDRRRAIELEQGEAQFEVTPDKERPFVVNIGEDSVTALGTRFQVRKGDGTTVVTLLEGRVEVEKDDVRHVLHANEQAVLSERTGIAIASIDPELATSWLHGWLRFRGTPLAEVIAEANRYSGQKLRLGDPRLADVKLSGNFHAGDNVSIAEAVSLILPVQAEQRESEIILLPR